MADIESANIYSEHKKVFTKNAFLWILLSAVIGSVLWYANQMFGTLYLHNAEIEFNLFYTIILLFIGAPFVKWSADTVELKEKYLPYRFNLIVAICIICSISFTVLYFIIDFITFNTISIYFSSHYDNIITKVVTFIVLIIGFLLFRWFMTLIDRDNQESRLSITKKFNIALVVLIVLQEVIYIINGDTRTAISQNILNTSTYIAILLIWFFMKKSSKLFQFLPAIIYVVDIVLLSVINSI